MVQTREGSLSESAESATEVLGAGLFQLAK